MDNQSGEGRPSFLKTTALGGFVFLVPLVIAAAILGKALELARTGILAIEKVLPIDSAGDLLLLNALAIAGLFVLLLPRRHVCSQAAWGRACGTRSRAPCSPCFLAIRSSKA